MNDFTTETQPWKSRHDEIKTIIVDEGITSIGNYAFYNYDKVESMILSSKIDTIGNYSIAECNSLKYVYHYSTKAPTTVGEGILSNCGTSTIYVFNTYSGTFGSITPTKAEGKSNEIYYYINNNTEILIYGNGYMEENYLDSSLYGYNSAPWAYNLDTIKNVRIEYGVRNIGNCSFFHFDYENSIETVTMKSSVLLIGENAFYSCSSMKSIYLSEGLRTIQQFAFMGCSMLSSITIPKSVTKIHNWAFETTKSLEQIIIKGDDVEFESAPFWITTSLRTIYFYGTHEPIYSLESNCLAPTYGCGTSSKGVSCSPFECLSTLSVVYVTSAYKGTIGKTTFLGKNVTVVLMDEKQICGDDCIWFIGNNVLNIKGKGKMSDFTQQTQPWKQFIETIEEIEIEETITSIGNYAFYGLSKVENLIIPEGIESLGTYSIHTMKNLKTLTLPNTLKTISNNAIVNCQSLISIYHLSSQIPTSIGSNQLTNCNVKSIYVGVTYNSEKLFGIIVQKAFESGGNIYYSIDSTESNLTIYGNGQIPFFFDGSQTGQTSAPWKIYRNTIKKISIQSGIKNIPHFAFFYNEDENNIGYPLLTTVEIGIDVKIIGEYAFTFCDKIQTVTLGKKLSSISIYAFSSCTSLLSITIPENVMFIGAWSFQYCLELSSVTIKSNQLVFENSIFWASIKLETIYYYGTKEPIYKSEDICSWEEIGCGTATEGISCSPFSCECPLKTVYVSSNYTETGNTFCDKSVNIIVNNTMIS